MGLPRVPGTIPGFMLACGDTVTQTQARNLPWLQAPPLHLANGSSVSVIPAAAPTETAFV